MFELSGSGALRVMPVWPDLVGRWPRADELLDDSQTTRPGCGHAAYTDVAGSTSCEEVSPRPVRTDAALGLRACQGETVRTAVRIGPIRRHHSPDRTQLHATMSGKARSNSS